MSKAPKNGSQPDTSASSEPLPNQTQFTILALADIEKDGRLQARAGGTQEEVIAEYAAAMGDGATFPAIEVVKDRETGTLWLVDGWHRVLGALRAGLENITARVVPGTWRDALLAAARANATNGVRRTQDDKRRAITLLLGDPEELTVLPSMATADARITGGVLSEVLAAFSPTVDSARVETALAKNSTRPSATGSPRVTC